MARQREPEFRSHRKDAAGRIETPGFVRFRLAHAAPAALFLLTLSTGAAYSLEKFGAPMPKVKCRVEASPISQKVEISDKEIRYLSEFHFYSDPKYLDQYSVCERTKVHMVYSGVFDIGAMTLQETYRGVPKEGLVNASRRGTCASIYPPFHPKGKCGSWAFVYNEPDKDGGKVPLNPWFVFNGIAGGSDVKKSLIGLYDQKMKDLGKSLGNLAKKDCKGAVELNSAHSALTPDAQWFTYAVTYKIHDQTFTDSSHTACKETGVREITYSGKIKAGAGETIETYVDSLGASAERNGKCAGGLYPPFHPKSKCTAWSFVKQKANSKGVSVPLDPWFDVANYSNGNEARANLVTDYDKMLQSSFAGFGKKNVNQKKQ
mgnify:CR=1 FL=1